MPETLDESVRNLVEEYYLYVNHNSVVMHNLDIHKKH